MKLNPAQRLALFNKYGGKCAYCGQPLPEKGWHADHVEPVHREWYKALRPKTTAKFDEATQSVVMVVTDRKVGMERPELDRIENMMPSCRACNLDKHCMSLEVWRRALEGKVRVLRDNYSAFRHAERFGLVAVAETKVVFYFEKLIDEETKL